MNSLVNENALSFEMARKVASSELCLQHLKLAIERNGLDGLTHLFSEKLSNGNPSVKTLRRIINNVSIILIKSDYYICFGICRTYN